MGSYITGEGAICCLGNPDGEIHRSKGTLAIDVDSGTVYKNTDGASAWSEFTSGSSPPVTEHLTGDNDGPIAIDLSCDTSFLSTTSAELGQQYTLADGTIDGQIHHFVAVADAAGDVYLDVASLYGGNDRFILLAADSTDVASMSLIWDDAGGKWHELGTKVGFTGPT
jgi:hypothetical protein